MQNDLEDKAKILVEQAQIVIDICKEMRKQLDEAELHINSIQNNL